ncbi:zf-HC2 domain-containing protein [Nocardia wallacei]|uniref:zf-HC2 domain-containing protein n=1 Tax=Nocardia wallacei TaxID=480035 RepID=UPI002457E62A|nr:zf-HC2 domain-containing protein [Nocardia wallacei]
MTCSAPIRDLTAPYVLDSLPDDEHEAFERHLGDCPSCSRDVAELRAAVVQIAVACAQTPTPTMRERVLDSIRATPQHPPDEPKPPPAAPRPARRWPVRIDTGIVVPSTAP